MALGDNPSNLLEKVSYMKAPQWRYPPVLSNRDLRLDFLRGYFVIMMTVDHMGTYSSWTRPFVWGRQLWFNAATGFILISGVVFGMQYRERVREKGWHWAVSHVSRRSLKLYLIVVVGQIVLATTDFVLRAWRGRPSTVPTNYRELIEGAIFQIHYTHWSFDLLPLYALLLLWGLGVVYLLENGRWKFVFFGSLSLWYAWHLQPESFRVFVINFRFAAWQFLFTIGVLGGYYRRRLSRWRGRIPVPNALLLFITALPLIITFSIKYWDAHFDWYAPSDWFIYLDGLMTHDALTFARIVAVVWFFVVVYEVVNLFWRPLDKLLGWLILPLGQNALLAYILQGVLNYAILRLPGYPFEGIGSAWMGVVHVTAVLIVWAVTKKLSHPFQTWLRC